MYQIEHVVFIPVLMEDLPPTQLDRVQIEPRS